MAEILRVREPFAYTHNGVTRVATAGKPFRADDPVVKGREAFFEPVENLIDRHSAKASHSFTETASAAPGEVRAVPPRRRPGKKESTDTTAAEE